MQLLTHLNFAAPASNASCALHSCMSVADDLNIDAYVMFALQALSPELCSVVCHPSTPPAVAATCFSIMAELAGALAAVSGTYQRQVRDLARL